MRLRYLSAGVTALALILAAPLAKAEIAVARPLIIRLSFPTINHSSQLVQHHLRRSGRLLGKKYSRVHLPERYRLPV